MTSAIDTRERATSESGESSNRPGIRDPGGGAEGENFRHSGLNQARSVRGNRDGWMEPRSPQWTRVSGLLALYTAQAAAQWLAASVTRTPARTSPMLAPPAPQK